MRVVGNDRPESIDEIEFPRRTSSGTMLCPEGATRPEPERVREGHPASGVARAAGNARCESDFAIEAPGQAALGTTSCLEGASRIVWDRVRSRYPILSSVQFEEIGGAVRLGGQVPTHYLKQVAFAAACEFAGPRPVRNEIAVIGSPSRAFREGRSWAD